MLALTHLARLLQGRWRTMRVIEHDVIAAEDAEMSESTLAAN